MKHSLLLIAVLALAACGDKKDDKAGGGGGGKVASCNMASLGSCREYRGGNLALGTDGLKKLCESGGAGMVFTETACPTDGVTGTCTMNEGKDFFYASYPIAIADAEKSCTERGHKFAAGQ